jgi:GDP-L-fucose synthase
MILAKTVMVTGSSGMLGSALCDALEKDPNINLIRHTRETCDLQSETEVNDYFAKIKPDFIFHCAAKVGGIAANKRYPVEFLADNIRIQNNVFSAAYKNDVQRVLFFASNAVYPESIDRPIYETDILTGQPEKTVRPYAVAKIAGIELCYSYNVQYGTKYLALIPVNLFGPKDNFHPENSHVLPSLIRKFHLAKEESAPKVEVWGSGNQRREFMCSLDLARLAIEVLNFNDDNFEKICNKYPPMINLGVGEDISIRELSSIISSRVGYQGEIVFDSSKPEGINKKQTSVEKMHSLGLKHEISLEAGIDIIYDYYKNEVHGQ